MKTLRFIRTLQPTLIFIYSQTDDASFNLWDRSNLIFATYTELDCLVGYIGSVVFYIF